MPLQTGRAKSHGKLLGKIMSNLKGEAEMKIFTVTLTDGSGDDGYGVALKKEASNWEDKSSAGHEISSITQSGNVGSSGGGLI
jgi:hypothetical protein